MLRTPARASTANLSQDHAQRRLQEAQLDIERKRHRKQAFAYEELCLSHFGLISAMQQTLVKQTGDALKQYAPHSRKQPRNARITARQTSLQLAEQQPQALVLMLEDLCEDELCKGPAKVLKEHAAIITEKALPAPQTLPLHQLDGEPEAARRGLQAPTLRRRTARARLQLALEERHSGATTVSGPSAASMEGIDEADSDSQQRPHPRQGDVKQAQSGQQQMQLPQLRSRRRHLALHHSHAGTEELLRGAQPTTGENDSVAEGLDAADPADLMASEADDTSPAVTAARAPQLCKRLWSDLHLSVAGSQLGDARIAPPDVDKGCVAPKTDAAPALAAVEHQPEQSRRERPRPGEAKKAATQRQARRKVLEADHLPMVMPDFSEENLARLQAAMDFRCTEVEALRQSQHPGTASAEPVAAVSGQPGSCAPMQMAATDIAMLEWPAVAGGARTGLLDASRDSPVVDIILEDSHAAGALDGVGSGTSPSLLLTSAAEQQQALPDAGPVAAANRATMPVPGKTAPAADAPGYRSLSQAASDDALSQLSEPGYPLVMESEGGQDCTWQHSWKQGTVDCDLALSDDDCSVICVEDSATEAASAELQQKATEGDPAALPGSNPAAADVLNVAQQPNASDWDAAWEAGSHMEVEVVYEDQAAAWEDTLAGSMLPVAPAMALRRGTGGHSREEWMATIVQVGEVGELAELFQWRPDSACRMGLPGFSEAERQSAGEEMSDVLLYLTRLADVCGIDLGAAV
eukprot:jgi/Astpho2/1728/Aster-04151